MRTTHRGPADDEVLARHAGTLRGIQAGLARLRGIESSTALLAQATEEACRGCGFARAILFQVTDEHMVPVSAYPDPGSGRTIALLAQISEDPPELTHHLIETEMMRRRMPILVDDTDGDERVHRGFVDAWGTPAYVAAPIMPEGEVIGFLHADRRGQDGSVDELDRDALAVFTEGLGFAFATVVLGQRLQAQRGQVRNMLASTEALIDELLFAEVEVSRIDQEDSSRAAHDTASFLDGAPSRLEQLLTPREIDVMRLLAAGETNSGVASRLVISEGTVKSHVKHILRKLRAANRAEAVSRYLRITALDRSG
ncbi:hypothetical protein DSM112329_00875 [Paraconexibacter sp. AEG42_29]|uniref:HTH luxR-type domain-containing protein n=1 Tax=Paraconexibacter sp. AEG42_29 TaxID=2997339 RepID=A0AAU7AQS9_9ACTN